jgi:hypothetical protein
MATASDLVSLAKTQVGVKESPANSNKVKYWDYYKEHAGVDYNGEPWCAAFVAWCMCQVGAWTMTSDEGRFRSCPALVTWAKKQGSWKERSYTPSPGDIVIFSNGERACHVGIIGSVTGSTILTYNTIEGNTSVTSNDNGGAVMQRNRTLGSTNTKWYILGFIANTWDEEEEVKDEDITKIVDQVWSHKINDYTAADRLYLCNKYDYDTSDPTGRGKELNNHDHIKWMAAKEDEIQVKLNEVDEAISKLTELVEAIDSKLNKNESE